MSAEHRDFSATCEKLCNERYRLSSPEALTAGCVLLGPELHRRTSLILKAGYDDVILSGRKFGWECLGQVSELG